MLSLEISYNDGNRTVHDGVSNLSVNTVVVAFVENNMARSIPTRFIEYVSVLGPPSGQQPLPAA